MFLSKAFYSEEHVQPHCVPVVYQGLLAQGVKIPLWRFVPIGQPSNLHKSGFHPTPICKRYGAGISADLAKNLRSAIFLTKFREIRKIIIFASSIFGTEFGHQAIPCRMRPTAQNLCSIT
jgi:hypothetical protein